MTVDCQKNWSEYISNLQSLFLTPSEDNHEKLLQLISSIMNSLPIKNKDDCILGLLEYSHEHIKDCLQVPLDGVPLSSRIETLGKIFSGAIKFQHPNVMHNITPSPLISSVAASCVAQLYNINPSWDFISAGFQNVERQIAIQLGNLVGWMENPGGISTTGGKGCISYAIQLGLKRALPNIVSEGISSANNPPVVITSIENHKSVDYVCRMLGIGINNCWRSKVHDNETMDIEHCKVLINKALEQERPIACIVLSGGNTAHLSIDDLKSISEYIDIAIIKWKLPYRPYIYFDTCVSWPWLFFKGYNFSSNPLKIDTQVLQRIKKAYLQLSVVHLADGCGFDFHKSGNSSYQASFFLTKNKDELYSLGSIDGSVPGLKSQGQNFVYSFIIEHSRSGSGIASMWESLQAMGINGYRSYVAHLMTLGLAVRKYLSKNGMELLNTFSLAPASIFFPTPPRANKSYDELLSSDAKDVLKHNEYTFSLFNYFLNQEKNGIARFVFRYIPQYRTASCGEDAAIIVIYPMSIHSNESTIEKLALDILSIKQKFDVEHLRKFDVSTPPTYVPR